MPQRNLAHIVSQAFNKPLLLEPAYARVFFSALGKETGVTSISIPQDDVVLSADAMADVTASFMEDGKRSPRFYQVHNGIAILPVTGTLVHKLGAMRPFSGMTGYDGITARLEQAVADPTVRGILLDIDSPGGQVDGAFDCSDMIQRLGMQKPVWALTNDMACSAAMLLASACSRRLVTQTGRMGSVGVLMVHSSYAGMIEERGMEITMIFSGNHKVDGNPYERLPEDVRTEFQSKIDATRQMFAQKVSTSTGMTLQAVLDTEAAVYSGEEAVSIGFAAEVVNSADAVATMVSALNQDSRGNPIMSMTAAEAATQERTRVMGILNCEEAKGREALASMLAGQEGMSVEQARAILGASAKSAPDTTTMASVPSQILACDEAKGRESLAGVLAADSTMTLDKAKQILTAAPVSTPVTGEKSLKEQILASPEARGREQLATALAASDGMTLEKAETLLKAAPKENAGASAWESYLKSYNTQAVSAEASDDSPEQASCARLKSFITQTCGESS